MEAYEDLERSWAEFNQLDPAGMVACSSGTAALHLALEAMQLPRRSQCICPDFTMVACPRAIAMAGLEPVFVDCDDRLLMDLSLACSELAQPQGIPTCLMAVHIYGRQLEMDGLVRLHDIVVEDLAEAHGIRPHPITDAAAWSFYRNKIVAGKEGGAVWFRDPKHATLARQLRSLGFTDAHDFTHIPRGHNYRMSNVHAELILKNFDDTWFVNDGPRVIDRKIKLRRIIEKWYDDACPAEWRMPPRDASWVYDIRVRGMSWQQQDEVVKALNGAGIAARHGFKPMHIQEEFKDCRFVYDRTGHRSSTLSSWTIYLPIQPGVTTETVCRRSFDIISSIVSRP